MTDTAAPSSSSGSKTWKLINWAVMIACVLLAYFVVLGILGMFTGLREASYAKFMLYIPFFAWSTENLKTASFLLLTIVYAVLLAVLIAFKFLVVKQKV